MNAREAEILRLFMGGAGLSWLNSQPEFEGAGVASVLREALNAQSQRIAQLEGALTQIMKLPDTGFAYTIARKALKNEKPS